MSCPKVERTVVKKINVSNVIRFIKSVVLKWLPTVGYCCRQGIHCCVCPQPLLNKDIKAKDNKQKPTGVCPARTEVDSEPQPKITTSSPACSNTFVACSFNCVCPCSPFFEVLLLFRCLCFFYQYKTQTPLTLQVIFA